MLSCHNFDNVIIVDYFLDVLGIHTVLWQQMVETLQ